MTKTELMKTLKGLGTEQCRKTLRNHGATGKLFGVRYADLYALQRQIKTDQRLAEQLWPTGNHDARILATLIADGDAIRAKVLDRWCADSGSHVTSWAVSTIAAKAPCGLKRAEAWIASKSEWVAATGWNVIAILANDGDSELSDAYLSKHLATIAAKLPGSKNRVRYSMNGALIAIGARTPGLQKKALAAAKRLGKVEVDHGSTSCKTPDAATAILKAVAHRKKKKATKKRPTKKKATKKKATKKKATKQKATKQKAPSRKKVAAR